jgi:hypothetical protein
MLTPSRAVIPPKRTVTPSSESAGFSGGVESIGTSVVPDVMVTLSPLRPATPAI